MSGFSINKKTNMVLKQFILPEEHSKANLFFSHYDTKRGDVGLIKVKNNLTLKFILGVLKHF